MSFIRGASIALVVTSVALAGAGLSGCAHSRSGPVASDAAGDTLQTRHGFAGLFGGKKATTKKPAEAGIGVNSYLWRATLDTLSFMPLASADPWGGVIITDWYVNPEKPAERFKTTVYILDTRLRADALNVTVFKQVKDTSGNWADSAVSDQTSQDIENSILTKARQLRLANIKG